jgi:glutamate N-acetyltransferase/amino-acid N-acetyltransferase
MIRGIQIPGKRCLYRLRANSALVLGSKFVAPFRCASSAISQTEFNSEAAYLASVESRAALPQGFRVGTSSFNFVPPELPSKTMAMTLTVIALDKPSPSFAALFTKNAFPGAPVIVGRALTALPAASLQAIVINNKVSNVCAPGGVEAAQKVAAAAAKALGAPPNSVLPCSTGIIGWRIPASELVNAMPAAAASLQRGSALPAAKGICTTDLYPKVRSQVLPGGARIVGIAKGAGMVEPGLATMLVYIMTDAVIDAAALKTALKDAVEPSFNSISIDTDMSTSECVPCAIAGPPARSPLS